MTDELPDPRYRILQEELTNMSDISNQNPRDYFFGFHVDDLKRAFDLVAPKDIRGPIDAEISPKAFNITHAAVVFYTATHLEQVGPADPETGLIRVKAIGYRAGPAGP